MGTFISQVFKTKLGFSLIKKTMVLALIYLICLATLMSLILIKSHGLAQKSQQLDQFKEHTQSLIQALIDQETGQRGFDLTGEKLFLEPYDKGTTDFATLSFLLLKDVQNYPNVKPAILQMIKKGNYWHDNYGAPQVEQPQIGQKVSTSDLLVGKHHFDSFRASGANALNTIEQIKEEHFRQLERWTLVTHISIVFLSILLFFILIFITLRTFARIAEPLFEVRQALKELAKGNFEYPISDSIRRHEELEELVQNLLHMRMKLQSNFQETRIQADTDALTGIFNRGYFDKVLNQEIEKKSLNGQTLYLILFDLDRFKQFNDTFGHTEGDRLLKHVTRIIKEVLSSNDLFARYGGEEFVVLTQSKDPLGLSEAIRLKIHQNKLDNYETTASFGVSQLKNGDSAKGLIDRADNQLYKAKFNGRNRVESDLS